jgi:hypothetical protein
MPLPNHNDPNLSVYTMVRNRLPFILDNPANVTLISNYTLEVMWQLEPCFKIVGDPPVDANVGDEALYSVIQRSIVADIVSCYILMMMGAAMSGNAPNTNNPNSPTFMKKVKAGSVEVEWDAMSAGAISLGMSSKDLLSSFKKSGINKAAQLGCIIDICDDCTTSARQAIENSIQSFVVFVDPSCGCCGG